jgi:hypothetical protein
MAGNAVFVYDGLLRNGRFLLSEADYGAPQYGRRPRE